MTTINIYLNFNGNTEEAFLFYKSVFGGEFTALNRFSETPDAEKMPESERNKLMHIALPLGKNMILMGTDALSSMGHQLTIGNNISLSIQAESKEEADKLFQGLSKDGTVEMPPQDTFWNAYFSSFTDKFGMKWMINFDYPKQ